MTSDEGIFTKNLHYPLTTIIPPGPMSPLNIKAQTFHFWLTVQVELWKMRVILLFATFTIFAVDLSYQKPAQFTLPAGIPTGHPLLNNDWPWELMYDDLMWAIDVLQNSPNPRQVRMATNIMRAWMGEVEGMRVHHQENASNQPVEA